MSMCSNLVAVFERGGRELAITRLGASPGTYLVAKYRTVYNLVKRPSRSEGSLLVFGYINDE